MIDKRKMDKTTPDRKSVTPPSREEIAQIVETVLSSFETGMKKGELNLYSELESLHEFILKAKREIALIRPDDIKVHYLPKATDELTAIIGATEEATGVILDAAEKIEKLLHNTPQDVRDRIQESVTNIYEACNFQDITGQRISKITHTLSFIDDKISSLLDTFGSHGQEDSPVSFIQQEQGMHGDKFLNGPQLPRDTNSQDDIDALFSHQR